MARSTPKVKGKSVSGVSPSVQANLAELKTLVSKKSPRVFESGAAELFTQEVPAATSPLTRCVGAVIVKLREAGGDSQVR